MLVQVNFVAKLRQEGRIKGLLGWQDLRLVRLNALAWIGDLFRQVRWALERFLMKWGSKECERCSSSLECWS